MFNKAGVSTDHYRNHSLEVWAWFYWTQPTENVYHRVTPQLSLILFEKGWLKAASMDCTNPSKMVPVVTVSWSQLHFFHSLDNTFKHSDWGGVAVLFQLEHSVPLETLPGHAMNGTCPARRAGSRHWWLQLRRALSSAVEVAPLSSVAFYHIVGIQLCSIRWVWRWTDMDNTSFPVSVALAALHCKTFILK